MQIIVIAILLPVIVFAPPAVIAFALPLVIAVFALPPVIIAFVLPPAIINLLFARLFAAPFFCFFLSFVQATAARVLSTGLRRKI